MKTVLKTLVLSLLVLSCKTEKANENITETPVKLTVNTIEKKQPIEVDHIEKELEQSKEMVMNFYRSLLEDDFVSTLEFNNMFGTIFNGGEIYLKSRYSKIDCYEVSDACESYIFSKMKKKSAQVTFNYSKEEIQKIIQDSGKESFNKNIYSLLLPDKENIIKFYFSKDKKLKKEIINDIVINSRGYFLAEFEE